MLPSVERLLCSNGDLDSNNYSHLKAKTGYILHSHLEISVMKDERDISLIIYKSMESSQFRKLECSIEEWTWSWCDLNKYCQTVYSCYSNLNEEVQ